MLWMCHRISAIYLFFELSKSAKTESGSDDRSSNIGITAMKMASQPTFCKAETYLACLNIIFFLHNVRNSWTDTVTDLQTDESQPKQKKPLHQLKPARCLYWMRFWSFKSGNHIFLDHSFYASAFHTLQELRSFKHKQKLGGEKTKTLTTDIYKNTK